MTLTILVGWLVVSVIVALAWSLMRGAKERRHVALRDRSARRRAAFRPADDAIDLHHLRETDAGLDNLASFSRPAAKGFNRDRVVGRDVVTRAEREWTQPVNRREMH